MPRINQYTDNTTIENDDKMLTYDTQGAATKLTAFSTIWTWIVSKLHALTSSSAALTPSTDRVLMDKNGTMTRVEPAAVAKYGIETYNGSTIAGSAQTVKSALDALNSKTSVELPSSYVSGGSAILEKCGNVVSCCSYVILGDSAIPAAATVFTIPSGYRPSESHYVMAPLGFRTSTKLYRFFIDKTNGAISNQSGEEIPAAGVLAFNFSYSI